VKRSTLILLLVAVGGFVFGLVHLFNLRFQSGDVYPPYSSLRADPLGTKALYESVDQLVPVSRHLQQWSKLGEGAGTTLLYLGTQPDDFRFRRHEFENLEQFVAAGGRLVVSFVTQYRQRARTVPQSPEDDSLVSAADRWGVDFEFAKLPREDGEYQYATARSVDEGSPTREELAWHTAMYFGGLDPSWKAVYAISNDLPVIIERPMGKGQIVLCSDSYPFSNEALLAERPAGLLAWFLGGSRRVVFEETHLGISEEPGLATLFRRYRLHGLAVVLLLLAGLYIWKNADAFVPIGDGQRVEGAETLANRGAAAGFVNLLRRNIPPGELMGVCLKEWKQTNGHRVPRPKLEAVQAVIDRENALRPKEREPVRIYRSITDILCSRRNSIY
jgi:hypothetical protein